MERVGVRAGSARSVLVRMEAAVTREGAAASRKSRDAALDIFPKAINCPKNMILEGE